MYARAYLIRYNGYIVICQGYIRILTLDILFSSNHNIHKNWYGHCFWASDHLIDGFC